MSPHLHKSKTIGRNITYITQVLCGGVALKGLVDVRSRACLETPLFEIELAINWNIEIEIDLITLLRPASINRHDLLTWETL